jgi:hypothetical protein
MFGHGILISSDAYDEVTIGLVGFDKSLFELIDGHGLSVENITTGAVDLDCSDVFPWDLGWCATAFWQANVYALFQQRSCYYENDEENESEVQQWRDVDVT